MAACQQFQSQTEEADATTLPWLGYCLFHLGEYKKALDVYTKILAAPDADPVNHLYASCCNFYLGKYKDAEAEGG